MKIKFSERDKKDPNNDLCLKRKNWYFDVVKSVDYCGEQEVWRATATLYSRKTHTDPIRVFNMNFDSRDAAEKGLIDFAESL